jgi:hypothetical protein
VQLVQRAKWEGPEQGETPPRRTTPLNSWERNSWPSSVETAFSFQPASDSYWATRCTRAEVWRAVGSRASRGRWPRCSRCRRQSRCTARPDPWSRWVARRASRPPTPDRPAGPPRGARERGTYSGLVREFVSAPLRSQTLWLHILPTETGFNSVVFGRGIQSALALGLTVAITSGRLVRCDVCAGAYRAQRRPRH